MNKKTLILLAITISVLTIGVGCAKQDDDTQTGVNDNTTSLSSTYITSTSRENNVSTTNAITYEKFSASDTGMSFDAPVGSEVFSNVNGFDDMWKFIYNGNSYLITYNEFRGGKAIYMAWDGIMADHKVAIKETTYSKVYTDGVVAHSESFFLAHNPNVSISVSKSEGTDLIGEPSPNGDDVVYQHLIQSMTLDGIVAF